MLNISRSALCVATTLAMALPAVAMADGPTVYGKANISVGFLSDDGDDTATKMDTNASRLGVKGSIDTGDSLSVTYLYEMQVDVTEDNATNLTGRNQFVGLKGGFGEVRFGRHDTAYKLTANQFDLWGDTDLDYNNIISNDLDKRLGDTIFYTNKINSLSIGASYTFGDGDETTADDGSGAWVALGVAYAEGPLYIGGAYTSEDDGESGFKIAGTYAFGAAKVGLAYESLDDGDSASDESNIWATMTYKIDDKNTLKLGVGQSSVDAYANNANEDTDRTLVALGIDHKLADKVTLYFAAGSGSDYGLKPKAGLNGDGSVIMGGMIVKF